LVLALGVARVGDSTPEFQPGGEATFHPLVSDCEGTEVGCIGDELHETAEFDSEDLDAVGGSGVKERL